jgi:hypothetical protein
MENALMNNSDMRLILFCKKDLNEITVKIRQSIKGLKFNPLLRKTVALNYN